ncbi:hypothetical protein Pcinc_006730 [Petrolisthes cinctipes]|uniref:SLED domain-containing protein n=1 Tax=Petrolisthes cinctipes TaxID=88211 RepID=A0AAE1G9S8_PETCI|nr:hypothetical protein Pcinc_006730 [Petrolisthes cinctipes]
MEQEEEQEVTPVLFVPEEKPMMEECVEEEKQQQEDEKEKERSTETSIVQDTPSPLDQVPVSVPDDEFVWEEYLEEIETEAVPPTAFIHVEKSLESGVLENQLVEVVTCSPDQQSSGYWLAKVITICGPLLRLRYVTQKSINIECWHEVVQGNLHPLGWSYHHNIPLTVPPDLTDHFQDDDCRKVAIEEVARAEKEGVSVPEEALEVDGYTAVDRIKQGMKVEVLFVEDPLSGWVATVMENIGGRLLLRYDTPDCSGDTFWLFYQHPRLRPPDWIHQNEPTYKYLPPSSCSGYEEAEWGALLEMSRADAHHSSMPVSLLAPSPTLSPHQFHVGIMLEAVHPLKPHVVCVAEIVEIINEHFFRIEYRTKTEDKYSQVTCINDPLVLPCGFCKQYSLNLSPPKDWESYTNFDWDLYNKTSACQLATQEMFPKYEAAQDLDFVKGLCLEAVNPSSPGQICAASVKQICGHLLIIQLDSEPDSESVIRASTSQELFPTGWSQANNFPLQLPAQYCPKVKRDQSPSLDQSQKSEETSQLVESILIGGGSQKSMWCPRLYVNHWCYTGPYLSKSKVAKQSQSVGPGTVELVLRKVLAMTINAAYIPTRVLREIQRNTPDPSTIPSSWRLTPFKAKFKRYNYTANLAVATTASDVSDFLYSICQTLQCCPNLWSPVASGENCPLLCTAQMLVPGSQSSGLRGRGRLSLNRGMRGISGAARIIHRRKRGGRKRLFVPVRANRLLQTKSLTASADDVPEDIEEEEEGELDEGDDDELVSGSDEGDTSSRSSRPTSPCLDRRQRKAFSRVDAQARGIKLTDYTTQMKARPGKKRFDLQDGASVSGYRDDPLDRREQIKRSRKNDFPDTNSGLEPATVTSDPLDWTVNDVEQYVTGQPAISHHAVKLKEEEVDGRAFLLLNLPTLVQHLGLPHSSAVALAQHICRVKLAHFMFFYRTET